MQSYVHKLGSCVVDKPICAQNFSLQLMAHTINSSYCSLEEFYNSEMTSLDQAENTAGTSGNNTSENIDKVSVTTVINVERLSCDLSSSRYLCVTAIIIGLFVLILFLTVVVLCTFFFRKYRKHQSKYKLPCH